ncbi:MAG: transcription antitermination factor NusB [Pseudomonadota bacterium]|jgi:N utilization substance protein B|uniref:Transcription antitermination protein NusB n=1 Tax=Caballeronia sordidicola TaxID=196367 RepID=A0A242MRR7_CABSO|nr:MULTISPECIES: transcription antitermination factor NusB [Burkholderiaceae]AME24180.1 N utilization substance protein B [Burkholderia sp. PAMC 26561]AMM13405.1 N utilization substance protein B [Burkholderia sp. PAMC 28687]MDP9153793.1 transcription antitermination factor NusB [Pseudomonadota bacterium]OTP74010.1 Transcription termination protein NusB [Caballeronia sordidicola]
MKSARRRSRELATQGLYQWLLSGSPGGEIDAQLRGAQGYDKADQEHLDALLHGVIKEADIISAELQPCLDRPLDQLSPVERAVLMVAAFEFKHHLDIPYRVVINEAIELTKTFGGSDGHKYVNGVLDKLAAQLRPTEAQGRGQRS